MRRFSRHKLQARCAEAIGIRGNQVQPLRVLFKGDGLAAAARAHPFDGNRTTPGADVPQKLIRRWRQRGKGCGADLAFGELAIMQECVVGQTRQARKDFGAGRCNAVDRQRVQGGKLRGRNIVGQERRDALVRATHVFQNGDVALAKSTRHQAAGGFGNGAGIGGQHDQADTWLDEGFDIGGVAAMQRQRIAIGQ